jgi:hypothetical protein
MSSSSGISFVVELNSSILILSSGIWLALIGYHTRVLEFNVVLDYCQGSFNRLDHILPWRLRIPFGTEFIKWVEWQISWGDTRGCQMVTARYCVAHFEVNRGKVILLTCLFQRKAWNDTPISSPNRLTSFWQRSLCTHDDVSDCTPWCSENNSTEFLGVGLLLSWSRYSYVYLLCRDDNGTHNRGTRALSLGQRKYYL